MTVAATRGVFETALASTPGLSGVQIAWDGAPFTPSGEHLRVRFGLVAPGPYLGLSGDSFADRGIFQVTVATPLGRGPKRAEELAQILRSRFRCSTRWGGATVIRPPEVIHGGPDEQFYTITVRIPFQIFSES